MTIALVCTCCGIVRSSGLAVVCDRRKLQSCFLTAELNLTPPSPPQHTRAHHFRACCDQQALAKARALAAPKVEVVEVVEEKVVHEFDFGITLEDESVLTEDMTAVTEGLRLAYEVWRNDLSPSPSLSLSLSPGWRWRPAGRWLNGTARPVRLFQRVGVEFNGGNAPHA